MASKVSHRDAYMELSAAKSVVASRGEKDSGVVEPTRRDRGSRGMERGVGNMHGHRSPVPVARADHADHERLKNEFYSNKGCSDRLISA